MENAQITARVAQSLGLKEEVVAKVLEDTGKVDSHADITTFDEAFDAFKRATGENERRHVLFLLCLSLSVQEPQGRLAQMRRLWYEVGKDGEFEDVVEREFVSCVQRVLSLSDAAGSIKSPYTFSNAFSLLSVLPEDTMSWRITCGITINLANNIDDILSVCRLLSNRLIPERVIAFARLKTLVSNMLHKGMTRQECLALYRKLSEQFPNEQLVFGRALELSTKPAEVGELIACVKVDSNHWKACVRKCASIVVS